MVLVVSACNDNDSWCEGSSSDAYSDSDGIKQVNETTVKVYSVSAQDPDGDTSTYGVWVDSGFYVSKDDDFQISATGQIIIATDYEDDTNLGDGKEFIIPATKGNVTPILDEDGEYFDFALNQQINVIIDDCGTNSADYCTPVDCSTSTFDYCIEDNGCKPNKWTWATGWQRDEINCNYIDVIDFYFGNDARSECYANRCCAEDIFGTCWSWEKWDCAHFTTIQENAYSSGYTDSDGNYISYNVCPNNEPGIYAYPYICDGNPPNDYYVYDTNPPYLPDGSKNEYCDGHGDDGTHSAPKCGDRSNSKDYAKEPYSYNQKGETDTCWNTGGYRLYAMEGGIVCPSGCDNKADSDNPCPDGCTHLRGGYATFDETKGETADFVGGVSFASRGDTLNLQIINPLGESTVDEEHYQSQLDQIDENNQTISYLEDQNDGLYDELTLQLELIDAYNPNGVGDASVIDSLRAEAETLSAGLIDDSGGADQNESIKIQLDYIVTLFDYTIDTGTDSDDSDDGYDAGCVLPSAEEGIQQMFMTLGSDIQDYSGNPEVETCWKTTIDAMDYKDSSDTVRKAQDIIDAGDDLEDLSKNITEPDGSTYLDTSAPGCTNNSYYDSSKKEDVDNWSSECYVTNDTGTTHQDIQNFIKDLDETLSLLEEDMALAVAIQGDIDDNNEEIVSLEYENEEINQDILEETSYGNDDLVGGYVVHVSAGALVADNGEYMHAVVSDGDPNVANSTTITTDFSPILNVPAGQSITYMDTVYTAMSSGNVWTFIDDPDGRWDNNSQYYDVTFGKVSYKEGFDALATGLIEDIKDTVDVTSERIFKNLTCSDGGSSWQCSKYLKIITAMLYLYIIIWGMMYLFGLIRTDKLDFIIRIVKIGTLTVLIQPGSFEFFNTYLFQGFSTMANTIIANATGAPIDNPFRFLNQNMNVLLLDETTYYKLMGMMVQGLLGLVVFFLILYGTISFIVAFFQSFLVYMISLIGLGIGMAVAPIYLAFLLFDKTKYLFTAWFRLMVRFAIQPVLLLIGLIIINGMLATLLDSIFNYYVCYKCAIPITFAIPGYPQVGTTTLFCISWFTAWGDDNVNSPATHAVMSIPLAIIYCMVTTVMELYTGKISGQVCKAITGGDGISTPGAKASGMGLNPFSGMDNRMKSIATGTGLVKDEKGYKALRSKMIKGAAMVTAAPYAVGAAVVVGHTAADVTAAVGIPASLAARTKAAINKMRGKKASNNNKKTSDSNSSDKEE